MKLAEFKKETLAALKALLPNGSSVSYSAIHQRKGAPGTLAYSATFIGETCHSAHAFAFMAAVQATYPGSACVLSGSASSYVSVTIPVPASVSAPKQRASKSKKTAFQREAEATISALVKETPTAHATYYPNGAVALNWCCGATLKTYRETYNKVSNRFYMGLNPAERERETLAHGEVTAALVAHNAAVRALAEHIGNLFSPFAVSTEVKKARGEAYLHVTISATGRLPELAEYWENGAPPEMYYAL